MCRLTYGELLKRSYLDAHCDNAVIVSQFVPTGESRYP